MDEAGSDVSFLEKEAWRYAAEHLTDTKTDSALSTIAYAYMSGAKRVYDAVMDLAAGIDRVEGRKLKDTEAAFKARLDYLIAFGKRSVE